MLREALRAGLAIATAPIALSTTSGMAITINGQPYWLPRGAAPGETIWSPPAMRPGASAPAVSVTSTEVSGEQLVTYTLTTGDQNGNTPTGDSATMSLSFSKPPRSRIPPVFVIGISGVHTRDDQCPACKTSGNVNLVL